MVHPAEEGRAAEAEELVLKISSFSCRRTFPTINYLKFVVSDHKMSPVTKTIFIVVALGMILLFLAGCGQQGAEISSSQEVSPSADATVAPPAEPAPPAATPTAAAVAPPETAPAPSPSPAPFMVVPEIGIRRNGFDPAELSLEAGDTVIWVNYDSQGVILSFTQDGREVFSSSFIAPKATYTHTFEQPGIYSYHVAKYGVTGRIVVR